MQPNRPQPELPDFPLLDTRRLVETPEGIDLILRPAGLMPRALAFGIDLLIRGAILEMLREEDWVPRSIRDRLKALDRANSALETKLGRPATENEIAEQMGVTVSEVNELLVRQSRTSIFSLDDILGSNDSDDQIHFIELIVDDNSNPGGEVEGKEIRRILSSGVDKLPDRERLVVALYYFEGLTFKEIGKVLTVSESRVYQLHTQAMNRLRNFMRSEGAVHA